MPTAKEKLKIANDKAKADFDKAQAKAKADAKAAKEKEKAKAALAKTVAREKAAKQKAADKVKADKAKEDAKAAKALQKIEDAKPAVLAQQYMDQAAQVNANQEIIVSSGNSMIMTAMESGAILTKLKAAVLKLKPKGWTQWMEENLELSDRQAQKYMKLAEDPKEVKKLLEVMGEKTSINAIADKIGQKNLSNDEIEAREAKKTASAEKRKEAAVLDIDDEKIDDAIDACMDISKLKNLIEYVEARIMEIGELPEQELVEEEEDDDDDDDSSDDLDLAAEIAAGNVDPLS